MKVSIKLIPKSSEDKIVGYDAQNNLKVKVKAPPVEGAANMSLIKILSKHFKTAKSNISIIKGIYSKQKLIEIKEN